MADAQHPPGAPMAPEDEADYWSAQSAWLRRLMPEQFNPPAPPAPATEEPK